MENRKRVREAPGSNTSSNRSSRVKPASRPLSTIDNNNNKSYGYIKKFGSNPSKETPTTTTTTSTNKKEGEVPPVKSLLERTWDTKLSQLQTHLHQLEAQQTTLIAQRDATQDVVEGLLGEHDKKMREMQTLRQHLTTRHEGRLAHLEKEEDGVIARRERGKMEVERLKEKATLLEEEGETLKGEVAAVEQSLAEAQAALNALQASVEGPLQESLTTLLTQEGCMKDVSYGLSGDVKEMVLEMEKLKKIKEDTFVDSMKVEVERRALASRYEEIKGSIRVYCRVRGSKPENNNNDSQKDASPRGSGLSTQEDDRASTTSAQPEENNLFSFPLSDDWMHPSSEHQLCRGIALHQTRANATSTGTTVHSESFQYDRVFPPQTTQSSFYQEVEPLVLSAVDGYPVCIFAYGQTGSGKTYTMEGSVGGAVEHYGVTPRAVQTILARQEELSKEGWRYRLRCTFIEIYNDRIRDLLQPVSLYEAGGEAYGNQNYHTIRHDSQTEQSTTTTITNLKEKEITDFDTFRSIYRGALRNRQTAKTQLNETSSRSHCIFTIYMDGENAFIRQRSHGVLCSIDLAGSERVNDSGVQGKELKEAININTSLLNLGKCMYALRSLNTNSNSNVVIPWRQSKLTYFLQHYLTGQGSKLLLIVNISNHRKHAAESLNSLRFAQRVSEVIVGPSGKRVSAY